MGKFMFVLDRYWLVLGLKQQPNLAVLAILTVVLMLRLAELALLLVLGCQGLSLLDCGLVVWQSSIAELYPITPRGCGVVVRGEPQGFTEAVTQTSDKGVGRVCDPVKDSY